MAERRLSVDHSTVARSVLRCAPILHQLIWRHLRHPNRSWRADETYIRVAGKWTYLYRALDSEQHHRFLLSPHRDRTVAKDFLQLAVWRVGHLRPTVHARQRAHSTPSKAMKQCT
ncbi:MAG: Integrase, catalytic region [Planctomycetaceae bacterium]|nr:Integrase, catalytic region [Planctomycetaceae bacterium]